MNINITKNLTIITMGIFISLLISVIFVSAQQKEEQPLQKNGTANQKEQKPKSHSSMGGLSSTTVVQDEGYKILTVRRVNHHYKRVINYVTSFSTISLVNIELHVAKTPEATNAFDFIIVGDQVFGGYTQCSSETPNCIQLVLTPEEFEQLRDNSIISFYKGMSVDPVRLRDSYRDGEPSVIMGIKFGRLNKQLINQFPPIDLPVVFLS